MLFAANEIAEVRELADEVRRGRARTAAEMSAARVHSPLERYQHMRLQEYHASLSMLQDVAPRHRLVSQLAVELDRCPISVRRARRPGLSPALSHSAATAAAGPGRRTRSRSNTTPRSAPYASSSSAPRRSRSR